MLKMIFSILIIMSLLTVFSIAYAASDKEVYELQERCKKSADAWFQENTPKAGESTSTFDHRNHYNKKLNKCFVLFTAVIPTWDANNKRGPTQERTLLMDVNENNEIGDFMQYNMKDCNLF